VEVEETAAAAADWVEVEEVELDAAKVVDADRMEEVEEVDAAAVAAL
jgi:hypothetical protein